MKYFLYFLLIAVVAACIAGYVIYHPAKISDDKMIDKIVVLKSQRKLIAYSKGKVVNTYNVSLGGNPVGPKEFEGDKKTPEGLYVINDKNPNSKYHKNLGISYPDKADRARAEKQGKSPGGDVKIHGLPNGMAPVGPLQRLTDWTNGCVALTNDEIDDLYDHTPVGTPIELRP